MVKGANTALYCCALLLAAGCGPGAGMGPSSTATPVATGRAATPVASAAGSSTAATTLVCVPGSISIAGSTAIAPLTDAAARMYVRACPSSTVDVQLGGSIIGLTQVAAGAVDIGESDVKQEATNISGLTVHAVAKQGFAIARHSRLIARAARIANIVSEIDP